MITLRSWAWLPTVAWSSAAIIRDVISHDYAGAMSASAIAAVCALIWIAARVEERAP